MWRRARSGSIRTARRAGTAVAHALEIRIPLPAAVLEHRFLWDSFWQATRCGGDVVDQPMHPGSGFVVRIIENER